MTKNFLQLLLGVSVLSFSLNLMALPNLKCITGGFPTTSFILEENPDNFELRVINHNGAKYAPVYSGIATPSDIEHIKNSGLFFEKIGDFFSIKFAKTNCRFEEDKFFTCFTREESEISGVKVNSVYFTTSESVDKIPGYEFTKTNVRLSLREHAQDFLEFRLEMSYYDKDCQILKK